MEAYAKYEEPTSTTNNLTTFFAALASAFNLNPSGGTGLEGQQAYNAIGGLFPGGLPTNGYEDPVAQAPKAYLNYILFDQNFIKVDMGWDQISIAAKQVGATPVVPHEYLSLHVKVKQAGYLYVYLSNENQTQSNVYFDDFQIRLTTSVNQVSNYYAFGLQQGSNGFERTDAVKNPQLFNGKENQDELSLGWLDYGARLYDASIARSLMIDPHADSYAAFTPSGFLANNPITTIDPDGMDNVTVTNADVQSIQKEENVSTIPFLPWLYTIQLPELTISAHPTPRPPGEVVIQNFMNEMERLTPKTAINYLEPIDKALSYSQPAIYALPSVSIEVRSWKPIDSRVGTFSRFASKYNKLGIVSRFAGGTAGRLNYLTGGALLYFEYLDPEISPGRFTYHSVATGASWGVGSAVGVIATPLVGAAAGAFTGLLFQAGEQAYDGLMWFGDELSKGMAHIESSLGTTWIPGKN